MSRQGLQPLNTEALYNRLMQDEDLTKMVLAEFCKDLPSQIEVLHRAFNNKDIEAIKRQAHKLKGAAGNVGAEILYQLMLETEDAARQDDYSALETLLNEIDNQLTMIKKKSPSSDPG